jgi:Tfp pilus assembly protein PilV
MRAAPLQFRKLQGNRMQGGFLIIEAAIAFVLVSIGIIGLMMLSVKGSRSAQENFERTEAVNLATQIVTKVRSSGDGLLEWNGIDVAQTGSWTTTNPATLSALQEMKRVATERLDSASVMVILRAPDGVSACTAAPCEVVVDVSWMGATQNMRNYSLYAWAGLQQ